MFIWHIQENKLMSRATFNEKCKTTISWVEGRDTQYRDKHKHRDMAIQGQKQLFLESMPLCFIGAWLT